MLKDIISTTIGFTGVILISFGAYLVLPAAGYIVAGTSLMLFSFLMSRATAYNRAQGKK